MSLRDDAGAGGAEHSAAGSRGVGIVLGAIVALLGLVVFWQISLINVGPSYARIGPRLFPGLIATGLVVIGVGIVADAFRRRPQALPVIDWAAVAFIGGGVVAFLLLLERAGFVIAAAALFTAVAAGFGNRRHALALAIGVALALVCQIGFNHGLGMSLPWGPLAFLG